MDEALAVHRLHFAFTVTYHYLLPQLTMGFGIYSYVQPASTDRGL